MRNGSKAEETELGHISSERIDCIKGTNPHYKHELTK